MPRVWLGCPCRVSFPWFSCARSPIHFVLFPPFLFYFCLVFFFLCGISYASESSFYLTFPPFLFVFLVSSSCSLLFFCSFMVGYSLVWSDCPSISFFFARLCGLLGIVGRKCPKVRLFVRKSCPYRFVLLFLFPLVHH